jgi:hypothetical protein
MIIETDLWLACRDRFDKSELLEFKNAIQHEATLQINGVIKHCFTIDEKMLDMRLYGKLVSALALARGRRNALAD